METSIKSGPATGKCSVVQRSARKRKVGDFDKSNTAQAPCSTWAPVHLNQGAQPTNSISPLRPTPEQKKATMNYQSIQSLREQGYIQEANRLFFHPRGLALTVQVDDDGTESLAGIQDYRADPEGVYFADGVIDPAKAQIPQEDFLSHQTHRTALLGNPIQPLPLTPLTITAVVVLALTEQFALQSELIEPSTPLDEIGDHTELEVTLLDFFALTTHPLPATLKSVQDLIDHLIDPLGPNILKNGRNLDPTQINWGPLT